MPPLPMWEPTIPDLMRNRTVYSIDLLGEPGKSIQKKSIINTKDQSQWIEETLDKLNLSKIHVLGVSIGGWLAINQIIKKPKRIVSGILIDPAYTFAKFPLKLYIFAIGSTIPIFPKFIREKMLNWISGGIDTSDIPISKLINIGMKNYKNVLPHHTFPLDNDLKSINKPLLVFIAGKSVIHNSKSAFKRAKSFLKNGETIYCKNTSHAIHGEHATEINKRINIFLDNIENKK